MTTDDFRSWPFMLLAGCDEPPFSWLDADFACWACAPVVGEAVLKAGAELTGRCAGSAPDCDEDVLVLLASEGGAALAVTALVIREDVDGRSCEEARRAWWKDYYCRGSGEEGGIGRRGETVAASFCGGRETGGAERCGVVLSRN